MDAIWAKHFQDLGDKLDRECICPAAVLSQLTPDELLTYAVENTEIFELCKTHDDLRRKCVTAALKKLNLEKYFDDEVSNRTANFMILLDTFAHIQMMDEATRRDRCKFPPCVYYNPRNTEDGAKNSGVEE
ncbi:uncharacterized protein LOC123006686 [Tribolium madens]|uniref:uncharacterized protein LOC123006686 n=1 Tax=Tribolium madens TaxID=41895 RepID=UPI001CF731C7|nr:uncharacterized protein LOC123006686 [Tribolium madens]